MPRTVEVQMQIDDSGAIQSLDAQGQAYEQVAESADDASEATERQAQAAQDAGTAAERGAQAQREQANAAEANEQAQREAAQSARQYAAASDRMAGASSNASQVIFSTGDAIQDAQFGLRGAANNIAFVAESFAELQRQSGGTQTAIQGLFAALKGPAGLILGLQALLALGPQIVDFFDSFIGGAEDAEKASERLNDALDEVFDFQDADLQEIDTAIGKTRRRLRQLREEVELGPGALTADEIFPSDPAGQIQTAIETLDELDSQDVSILPGSENIQEIVRSVEAVENPAENARRALVAVLRDFRERSPQTLDEIDNLEAGLERLQKKRKQVATEVEARNALSRAGVTLLQEEEKQINKNAKAIENRVGALQTLNEVTAANPSFSFEGLDEFLKGNAEKQARRMQEELKALRAQMGKTEQQALDLGPALEQGLADSIASTAQAVGQGKSVAKALLNTLASLAQQVGKMMIQFGTAALGLRNLISNPALAIAAGASLVALGAAAKQAIGSEIDSATGGGGAPGGPGSERTAEGGGEIGAEVDAPGRRRGGPVRAGQLYQTHGLGQREFFRPATDGQIVTAGGMQAAAGESGGGAQRVETSHEVSVEVNDPSLFDLRQQLNELDSDVSELT
ncbi:hypothetical protein SRM_p11009 (plasmid) [Salinibacter ruber M8]|uniref:Uncharacterized protein n=1 Tax=Salinibacter ruber (strain M8) TaxID=761659 RepID=D5H474_SALRM|nr:hypothetical protein [Salinibacter ruber]CBH22714.1 hypothetical protein SRM_p11009 [Salinibacter ruber M8]